MFVAYRRRLLAIHALGSTDIETKLKDSLWSVWSSDAQGAFRRSNYNVILGSLYWMK